MCRVRVLIIERHSAVRKALAERLNSDARLEVVATARTVEEGVAKAHGLLPDVVLVEPKGIQPHLIRALHALDESGARVIVLTSYSDEDERLEALHAGARRYLLKNVETPRLVAEIESVAAEPVPVQAGG